MEVQIFGTRKNAVTRKALRFFSERGWKTHFVDLAERPPSPGELRRFSQTFGVEALIDRDSARFRDLGLAAAPPGEDRWIERLLAEPLLLRQPLVRSQNRLTVGFAESEWREWSAR
jgi:arsenate reductase-like glutaredoxin family protein